MSLPTLLVKAAGVSGVAAVALGTYGSHGFKPADPHYKQTFETASKYHLVHTVALLAAPLWTRPAVTGSLFVAGLVLFSGSCYVTAFKENRAYSRLAPIGGVCFMLGWLSLVF